MIDYDIHSCGYYCDRPACIVAQRNELRDKLFSNQAVKTYSGGKPNYTQPIKVQDDWALGVGHIAINPEIVGYVERQREWVGLTDEEKKAIYEKADAENWHDQPLLEAVEAKLKDKNT